MKHKTKKTIVRRTEESFSGLDSPTLVLNKNWQPINAITVRKSLKALIAHKALIVCPTSYNQYEIEDWMSLPLLTDEPFIQTSKTRIKIPEVIINKYGKIPTRKVVFSRRNLWRRDNFRCQFCGIKPKSDEVTIEHILPKSRGGKTNFTNCVLACLECNQKKDNHLPEECGMRLRRYEKDSNGLMVPVYYHRPVVPKWNPIYCIKRQKLPTSWSKFVSDLVDDLYWNTELDEE